jgi:heme/copper-type cytochrome/quinol oxidase subunit 2
MTRLFRRFGSLLGRYFRYWQLTIGLISLVVQFLIFQLLSGMGWGTYLNYWVLLASHWLGITVFSIWLVTVSIEIFLTIVWVMQWFQKRESRKITSEAMSMLLFAIGLGLLFAFSIFSIGVYNRMSSLDRGDRQYHLFFHAGGNTIPTTFLLDCDRTGFYCRQIELPSKASVDLLTAWNNGKGKTSLIYNSAMNTFVVTTPTTLISLDRSPH